VPTALSFLDPEEGEAVLVEVVLLEAVAVVGAEEVGKMVK